VRLVYDVIVPMVFQFSVLQPRYDFFAMVELNTYPPTAPTLAYGIGSSAATEWVQDYFAWVGRELDYAIKDLRGQSVSPSFAALEFPVPNGRYIGPNILEIDS